MIPCHIGSGATVKKSQKLVIPSHGRRINPKSNPMHAFILIPSHEIRSKPSPNHLVIRTATTIACLAFTGLMPTRCFWKSLNLLNCRRGGMVDTTDLKSVDLTVVPVRVRPAARFFYSSLGLQDLAEETPPSQHFQRRNRFFARNSKSILGFRLGL